MNVKGCRPRLLVLARSDRGEPILRSVCGLRCTRCGNGRYRPRRISLIWVAQLGQVWVNIYAEPRDDDVTQNPSDICANLLGAPICFLPTIRSPTLVRPAKAATMTPGCFSWRTSPCHLRPNCPRSQQWPLTGTFILRIKDTASDAGELPAAPQTPATVGDGVGAEGTYACLIPLGEHSARRRHINHLIRGRRSWSTLDRGSTMWSTQSILHSDSVCRR